MKSWAKTHRIALAFALAMVYPIAIAVLIWAEPEPGSPSETRLQTDAQAAFAAYDGGRLDAMFDGAGEDYAGGLADQLRNRRVEGIRTSLLTTDRGRYLAPTGRSAEGLNLCGVWPIARADGRYLLDPVPDLAAPQCDPR